MRPVARTGSPTTKHGLILYGHLKSKNAGTPRAAVISDTLEKEFKPELLEVSESDDLDAAMKDVLDQHLEIQTEVPVINSTIRDRIGCFRRNHTYQAGVTVHYMPNGKTIDFNRVLTTLPTAATLYALHVLGEGNPLVNTVPLAPFRRLAVTLFRNWKAFASFDQEGSTLEVTQTIDTFKKCDYAVTNDQAISTSNRFELERVLIRLLAIDFAQGCEPVMQLRDTIRYGPLGESSRPLADLCFQKFVRREFGREPEAFGSPR